MLPNICIPTQASQFDFFFFFFFSQLHQYTTVGYPNCLNPGDSHCSLTEIFGPSQLYNTPELPSDVASFFFSFFAFTVLFRRCRLIPINSHQLFDICTLLLVHSRLSSHTINTTTSSANSSLPPSSSHTSFRKSSTLSSTPPTNISNHVGNRLWHQGLDPQDSPLRQIFAKERNLASAASSFAAHHESLHSQAGTRHIRHMGRARP